MMYRDTGVHRICSGSTKKLHMEVAYVLRRSLSSTLISNRGALQYLLFGSDSDHQSARNLAVSRHDFLVKQKTMIGFFCEYFDTRSGSLKDISLQTKKRVKSAVLLGQCGIESEHV